MPVKNYYSRNGQIEFEAVGSNVITYGRDMLGNVVAGYDNATNAVFTANYKPYGEFAQTTGNISGQRFLYGGSWGLRFSALVPVSHYAQLLHMLMRMGMWSSWPVFARRSMTYTMVRSGQSQYPYVSGNPSSRVDPYGIGNPWMNEPPAQGTYPRSQDPPYFTAPPPRRQLGNPCVAMDMDSCVALEFPLPFFFGVGGEFCVTNVTQPRPPSCCENKVSTCSSAYLYLSAGPSFGRWLGTLKKLADEGLEEFGKQFDLAAGILQGFPQTLTLPLGMARTKEACCEPFETRTEKFCASVCVGVGEYEGCYPDGRARWKWGFCIPGFQFTGGIEVMSCR